GIGAIKRTWHNVVVGQEVIDGCCADSSRIDEISDLKRRSAMGKDAGAGSDVIAFEIDGDVDFAIAHKLRDLAIGLVAHVDEVLECTLQPLPELPFIILAE